MPGVVLVAMHEIALPVADADALLDDGGAFADVTLLRLPHPLASVRVLLVVVDAGRVHVSPDLAANRCTMLAQIPRDLCTRGFAREHRAYDGALGEGNVRIAGVHASDVPAMPVEHRMVRSR